MSAFDIAAADTYTAAVRGVEMPLLNPKTGEPFREAGADGRPGKPVTISVYGHPHPRVRDAMKVVTERQLRAHSFEVKRSDEEVEQDDIDVACAATFGWSFTALDGAPFPYSEENARRFYADPRFRSVRRQVLRFVNSDGNFLPG
jgi:hypothetical protein